VTEKLQIEGRPVKIIVVDDEEIVLSLVRDALEDAGYDIALASSSYAALERIEKEYFDFILTDIRMPECDGIELAKKAREFIPSIGVVFMTGYANLNTAKDAIKEGAYDYIMKPFELNEIRQAVKNAVKKKQKDTEKTLALELNRLSDLNQLMYTVGDRKSLVRLSLGFALMQGKVHKGAIAYNNGNENEIGLITTSPSGENQFEEFFGKYDRDFLNYDSEILNTPFIITDIGEHPLYKHFADPKMAEFIIPPWFTPGERMLSISLKRGPKLYGFLMLEFPMETDIVKASDLKLLTITASQIAISLENIILLEETRNAYRRLKDLQDQTIGLEKMAARGQSSAEIGHELNNFLGVIFGNISLLEHHLRQQNNPELMKYLGAVINNLDNIKKFTQGLMDFSSMKANFVLCDITALVNDIIDYLKVQKRFHNIAIQAKNPSVSIFTLADTGQIQQLLYNLANNAADALKEKGKDFAGKIDVRLDLGREGDCFTISVADNGPGIDKEHLREAFQSRFTTKETGHGFGLLVCRRIIDNHGANLRIDSTPGAGTTIAIDFPIKVPQKELTPAK
jgi:signal transduction histidine kinase/CheY-like chemotaxis protein